MKLKILFLKAGVILIGMFFLFASLVLAVAADLFQNLMESKYDKMDDTIIEKIVKARKENFDFNDALNEKDVMDLLDKNKAIMFPYTSQMIQWVNIQNFGKSIYANIIYFF